MKIIKNAELLQVKCSNCNAILLPILKDLKKNSFGDKDRVKCPICKNTVLAQFKRHETDEE